MRHDAIGSEGRELRLLSLAASVAIDRGLRGAEEGLQSLRSELEAGHLVLDAQGRLLAGSDQSPGPDAAAFLPRLDLLARDGGSLSRPVPAADDGGDMVALALRFAGPGGQDGGWVVAAMPDSALLGLLADALLSTNARLIAVRSDGARLASVNGWPSGAGETATLLRQLDEPTVALRARADGSEQVVAEQTVQRYGVTVRVACDLDAVLLAWRQAAEGAVVALLVLLAVMASAVYFVQVADRRREKAQAALQAQVSRAGKLESLGTLAGGVAHDFNNVLAGILGFGEMAQDAAVPGSAQARHIDKLVQAALRGKALVERILTFSRGGARASEVFELAPVVEEVLSLLSGSLREGITVAPRFEAPKALPRDAGRGAGQRLLVVDDEPELVALAVETLQALGYAPEGHSDPTLALEALREDPQGFAAVITDEVMPGLTGTQLTQALRAFAPQLPVLLVSGYGGALLAQRASAVGVSRVLAKPMQRASLAQALAEVLGKA